MEGIIRFEQMGPYFEDRKFVFIIEIEFVLARQWFNSLFRVSAHHLGQIFWADCLEGVIEDNIENTFKVGNNHLSKLAFFPKKYIIFS